MNYDRIYSFRFKDLDQGKKQAVWNEIAKFVSSETDFPERVLNPASGFGEFICAVDAKERWSVDLVPYERTHVGAEIKHLTADIFSVELPDNYFDCVFVSNFLEHLESPERVSDFLTRMFKCLRPGGRIAIMGPNFKYCADVYFDCADHSLALTDVGVSEHLYGAGFDIEKSFPKFLPYSFRGKLPPSETLVRLYLKNRWAWSLLGKQFLVIGQKPE